MAEQDEEQNPFEILGITPGCLKDLRDDQIMSLVADRAKALARLFHSDITGNTATDSRLVAVNNAKADLEIPPIFAEAKRNCLIKLKRQIRREQLELGLINSEENNQASVLGAVPTDEESYKSGLRVLAAYVLGMAQGRTMQKDCFGWAVGIFRLPPCSILLEDTLAEWTKAAFVGERTRRNFSPALFADTKVFSADKKRLELVVGADGTVESYSVKGVLFKPGRYKIPADVPEEWVFMNELNPEAGSFYCRRTGKRKPFPGKLLGSIAQSYLLLHSSNLRPWQHLVLPLSPDTTAYVRCLEGFSAEEFAPLAPYMVPGIALPDPLVAFMPDTQRFRIYESVVVVRLLGKTDENQGAPAPDT